MKPYIFKKLDKLITIRVSQSLINAWQTQSIKNRNLCREMRVNNEKKLFVELDYNKIILQKILTSIATLNDLLNLLAISI
ncbi:hypothetical protein RCL_jg9958.t1 [Rhizophagus clarus]|uniref:Uncharacterized protein n=1 Tax=Rhizophagus clarus TaxID=94130 RepID=A0A8H3KR64_9GLOM|nr:hypothetical protein RCL_jg9958.t1 [Rhizophagus clarus]